MTEPFDFVLGQMNHLGYKNWDCGCKRNAATAVMTRNYPREELNLNRPIPFRAIAVAHSSKIPYYGPICIGFNANDPIRVAAMMADKPWDEIILVGDRRHSLYDILRVVKTPSELPPIESFDCKKNTLIIFDECGRMKGRDLMIMEAFAIRSRLYGVFTLFLENDQHFVPLRVQKNADVIYVTTTPTRAGIERMFNISVPAGENQNHWLKFDMRNDKIEVIDASKYYP